MTQTNAKLLLASKNAVTGDILYSWLLTFPTSILAEINTHRVASRNTSSSRAIPGKKMRKRIIDDPFVPVSIGAMQKGMQAGAEITGWRRWTIEKLIRVGRYPMVALSWALEKLGAHKQVLNRYTQAWGWTTQLFTATDVSNVFKLRAHKDAEPHFQILAKQMQAQVKAAELNFVDMVHFGRTSRTVHSALREPSGAYLQILQPGEWHLPFINEQDWKEAEGASIPFDLTVDRLKRVSTARCARTSYTLLDTGKRSDIASDLDLCNKLSTSGHWSPFEHVAEPLHTSERCGNFRAFKQYRKEFADEAGGDR